MSKSTLMPFQAAGVRRIHEFEGRALLADEVGLGKTFQALYYAWKYLPDDPPGPIVVVVPSHLKINWKREAQKHLGIRVEILSHQRVPADKAPPQNPNQVYVINYDVLVPPKWRSRMKLPKDSWVHWLRELHPRLVILDEGHYVKSPEATRSRAAKKLCDGVDHVLILTGTPLPNKPVDLWYPLHILQPSLFPSKFEFLDEFTHTKKRWWGWEHKGAKNLDVLHQILTDRVMIRRRKQDVLDQLPPVTHEIFPVQVDLREYREAEEDYIAWLEIKCPMVAENAAKAKDLVRLNGLKHMAGELKVPAVMRLVEDYLEGTESKLLLGAIHYSVTEPMMDFLGKDAVLVDGRMSAEQKQTAFDRFNHDPDTRVMVGNLDAAGTGWSCKSTSNVWICEFPWVPGTVEQFVGRIHGIERGIPGTGATVRHLVAAGTIDEDITGCTIRTKLGWSIQAIDGDDGAGWSDVYSQVKNKIRARVKGEVLV